MLHLGKKVNISSINKLVLGTVYLGEQKEKARSSNVKKLEQIQKRWNTWTVVCEYSVEENTKSLGNWSAIAMKNNGQNAICCQ